MTMALIGRCSSLKAPAGQVGVFATPSVRAKETVAGFVL